MKMILRLEGGPLTLGLYGFAHESKRLLDQEFDSSFSASWPGYKWLAEIKPTNASARSAASEFRRYPHKSISLFYRCFTDFDLPIKFTLQIISSH